MQLANPILPDNVVKGTVFPNEDWFKFDVSSAGTIVGAVGYGKRRIYKLYGPNKKIVSEEIVKVE